KAIRISKTAPRRAVRIVSASLPLVHVTDEQDSLRPHRRQGVVREKTWGNLSATPREALADSSAPQRKGSRRSGQARRRVERSGAVYFHSSTNCAEGKNCLDLRAILAHCCARRRPAASCQMNACDSERRALFQSRGSARV